MGNLEAAITARERLQRTAPDPRHLRALVDLYGVRARYLGRLSDYDRALALAEELVRRSPKEAQPHLARAAARAALHRFAEAEADLEAARELGAAEAGHQADGILVGVLAARGQIPEALALSQRLAAAEREQSLAGLAQRAGVLGALGQTDAADALFTEAQLHYRDVSPFPVAGLYFQHGLLWQRAGRPGRAREFFAAAVQRLPGYAPALGHLAAVESVTGGRQRAAGLLQQLLDSTEDPEYAGQLSVVLRELGQAAAADALRRRAAAGYAALLKRQPLAFAGHAARFYLSVGEIGTALEWARRNLAAAPAPEAFELALEVTLAAGRREAPAGCGLAERALAQPVVSQQERVLAARALGACGKQQRAEEVLRGLQRPDAAQ